MDEREEQDDGEIHMLPDGKGPKHRRKVLKWDDVLNWFAHSKRRMDIKINGDTDLLETAPSNTTTAQDETKCGATDKPMETQVYARRWIILGLFCTYSMSNAYQWIHLNIIYDVIRFYYNSSIPGTEEQQSLAVDWLSMVYMLAYIPLIFPATWLLDRKGLRVIGLLGSFLNCLGAWLKCAAVSPDRFWLLMIAQTICAIGQVFILGLPARLAAVWFSSKQVSSATALGVFGNQFGVALGFVIPPYVVKIHQENIALTGQGFSYMFYSGAGFTTVLFALVILVFKKEPLHPPSNAQKKILEAAAHENYLKSLVRLLKNWPFMLLVCTYGMNVGVYYAIGTLLNPIIFGYFSNDVYTKINEDAGWIGLTLVIAGLLGSIIAGVWLDRMKLFKVTTVGIYLCSLVCLVVFTFTLQVGKIWIVYITAGGLGLFMTGYLPVGFEFAAELTYPESEGTSSGLLNASAQSFGITMTLIMGMLLRLPGDTQINIRNANLVACGILLVGTALTLAIKNNLHRQHAENHHHNDESGNEIDGTKDQSDDSEIDAKQVDLEEKLNMED